MCDQVAEIQENIVVVKEERRFLLRKLLEFEGDAEPFQTTYRNSVSPSTSYSDHLTPVKKSKKRSNSDAQGTVYQSFCIEFGLHAISLLVIQI